MYIPEILPEKGNSLCAAMNWASAFIIGLIFKSMVASIGLHSCFLIFGGCTFVGVILIQAFVIETKNLTPEQVERVYAGKKGELLLQDDSTPNSYTVIK